ncbi:unnamed protein product [Rotaria sp. Silwood1]|nr:unnamed protein product [Rotaria sp. Silwood1]CAF1397366.1 unnamed protein product [Rotaria sp. Silwood1]CAF3579313.1 unnamed protein product [Rotaria sp. Silwood1]CAF3605386.1 unnamed protein product [Rotaria sp. Silwood1]CAF4571834.1 unnamed protein product [Rotaria sp. Silwood1]
MSVDVDFFPHLIMKDNILTTQYDRRNSWTPSISSSSSSTTITTNTTSWFERKLFSHIKRFFRRKSTSSISNSSISSRRTSSIIEDNIITLPVDEQIKVEEKKQQQEEEIVQEEEKISINNNNENLLSLPSISNSIDLLYDYDRLLARCTEQHQRNRTEMISRCQIPISIPHADLIINQSRTIIINWKSYIRLFNSLKRDSYLFQQYINQYYSCQSLINQREQLILNIRTTKIIFDNVLRKFLDDYVTCLICQTAQTHLIKSDHIWRIECQLCGIQRIVKRLKWKHHQ